VVAPSDVIRKRAEVSVRATNEGALLVDLMSGRCWKLNRLGADFFSQIESEQRLTTVCDVLTDRYDVTREVLERDILRLAQELLDAGLIDLTGK
jgi:hypothetical protein